MASKEMQPSPLQRLRFEMVPTPSQREIARRSKIDAGTIGELETGRKEMALRHAEALGPIFGISAPDLLKEMAEWHLRRRASLAAQPERAA